MMGQYYCSTGYSNSPVIIVLIIVIEQNFIEKFVIPSINQFCSFKTFKRLKWKISIFE